MHYLKSQKKLHLYQHRHTKQAGQDRVLPHCFKTMENSTALSPQRHMIRSWKNFLLYVFFFGGKREKYMWPLLGLNAKSLVFMGATLVLGGLSYTPFFLSNS